MKSKLDIIGAKIRLIFGEPWDLEKTVVGMILQQFTYDNQKTYFLIEDFQTSERFIISNRYVGEQVADIDKGKEIVVAVGLPEDGFSFPEEHVDFLAKVTYFGIGAITLVKS